MYIYHDFTYAEYVVNSEFDKGYNLYVECIKRIEDQEKQILDDRLWASYIISRKEITFENYKKEMIKETTIDNHLNNYSDKEKINKSEEIIKRAKNLENKINEIEQKEKINNIVNEVIL
jgi:hypothetical protein